MKFIKDLKEGDWISDADIYLCKSKQTLTTKSGNNYDSLLLQDKTGTVDAKIWDYNGAIHEYEAMDFVHIRGRVISFQGALQVNVSSISKAEGGYHPEDYFPVSTKNIDAMYEELLGYISDIKSLNIKELVEHFFVQDKEFLTAFKKHSAGKSIHHAFVGGLLEHTLGVVRLCVSMANNYPVINRDLLVAAALFHDIGKLYEISAFPENDYTDVGQLMGHIFIGANKISEQIKKMPSFPKQLANDLIHCILSHHGELEYGSPKKPAIIEALALSHADNADAKIQTMTEFLAAGDPKKEWVGYHRNFETYIKYSAKDEN